MEEKRLRPHCDQTRETGQEEGEKRFQRIREGEDGRYDSDSTRSNGEDAKKQIFLGEAIHAVS